MQKRSLHRKSDTPISVSNGLILIKFARNLELSRKGNLYLTEKKSNIFDLTGKTF